MEIFLLSGVCLFIYISIAAAYAIWRDRADVADIAWGGAFLVTIWPAFFQSPFSYFSLTLNVLVTIWAFRLSLHIYQRNHKRSEDFRYVELKKNWSKHPSLNLFFRCFMLQGACAYLIALPVIWLNVHPEDFFWYTFIWGILIWAAGFGVEALADYQLARFKKSAKNKGHILQTGLWSYVRHPNYLGEIIQWWGIWSMTASSIIAWPMLISPLLITFMLVKVSGVPMLEEKMKKHPEFADYAKKTPTLFPFSLTNAVIYAACFIAILYFAAHEQLWACFLVFIIGYALQMLGFFRYDRISFHTAIPLSIYFFATGVIQESLFIHLGLVQYVYQTALPPIWLLFLYPLFALTLNSSSETLNRNSWASFFIVGLGVLIVYFSGVRMGDGKITSMWFYLIVPIVWGSSMLVWIRLNRKLLKLEKKYAHPQGTLTAFFDGKCPVCKREMASLKNRTQTGVLHYVALTKPQDLSTQPFSYSEAMQKMHAVDEKGKVFTGTDALAEIYSRTDLVILSVLFQAPGFRKIFQILYAIWAFFRKRS